jgi:hypothetical protein
MKPTTVSALLAALALTGVPAHALVRGTTDSGHSYVSGGIGSDEVATINAERRRYGMAILTAATGTGAFLSDVHIRITDEHAAPVLETQMDGPWLLVDLPPGRYTIEAGLDGQVKKTTVPLGAGAHQQATFYFDTHDEVQPTTPEPPAPAGH